MEHLDFKERVHFIMKFGRALHEVGSPAHTLESNMSQLCALMGISGQFVSLPTAIFASFSDGENETTKIERVEPTGIDLGKLSDVDLIVQAVIKGEKSIKDASYELEKLKNLPLPFNKFVRFLCFVTSSLGFMILFGGSLGDVLGAGLVGSLIGLLSFFRPIGVLAQIFEGLIAFVASLTTYLLLKLFPGLNAGMILLSGLIIFMPGLFITIAIAEIATQNLTSGTSRLMGGAMILMKLSFGAFVGMQVSKFFHYPSLHYTFAEIPEFLIYPTLPLTALASLIIFKAKLSDAIWVMMAGIVGYLTAKLGSHYLGAELGLFFGGICVGGMSNIFARYMNRPSSIFQFPGIILLVPGSVGYKSLSFLFERNVVGGMETAFTMILMAMSLTVGVFVGNILIKPRQSFPHQLS